MQAKGFTLIEIMLVLVMMAVLTAMVAPNFFHISQASVRDEARLMQKVLRVAAEEAQLTGKPVRCAVYDTHLLFETPDTTGKWREIADPVFQQALPQAPVTVLHATLDGGVDLPTQMDSIAQTKEKPPLLRIMFWADGSLTPAHLTLGIPKQTDEPNITLELKSGPGGIRVVKPA